jgi:DNA-directed RNA polymerase subunit F
MTDALERAVNRIRKLPAEQQDQAADLLAEFIPEHSDGRYVLSDDENRLVDEAIAELDTGKTATDAEVQAVYAKYRR